MSRHAFEERLKNPTHAHAYVSNLITHADGARHAYAPVNDLLRGVKSADHFTAVLIEDIKPIHFGSLFSPENVEDLANSFTEIYHYYLHGPAGNVLRESKARKPAFVQFTDTGFVPAIISLELYRGNSLARKIELNSHKGDYETRSFFCCCLISLSLSLSSLFPSFFFLLFCFFLFSSFRLTCSSSFSWPFF